MKHNSRLLTLTALLVLAASPGAFATDPPRALTVRMNGGDAVLSWPTNYPTALVQSVTQLPSTNWLTLTQAVFVVGAERRLTNTVADAARFYRLCDGVPLPPHIMVTFRQQGGFELIPNPGPGGCGFDPEDGTPACTIASFPQAAYPLVFDASATVDRTPCVPAQLSYQWEFYKSEEYGSEQSFPVGTTNFTSPVLTIEPNGLPSLLETTSHESKLWRVKLFIRHEPFDPDRRAEQESLFEFKFEYQSSSLPMH